MTGHDPEVFAAHLKRRDRIGLIVRITFVALVFGAAGYGIATLQPATWPLEAKAAATLAVILALIALFCVALWAFSRWLHGRRP